MPRRTFFSFHYQPDVWRAWNVRNCWMVKPAEKEDQGFFDGSVFEASKRESDDSLKAFLRDGLRQTSVTCILAGTQTWHRRWVRYEIVRSVLKGNGLLVVDIDGIKNRHGALAAKGPNPLDALGLYRTPSGIYFAEWRNNGWIKYGDYGPAVSPGDLWFAPPPTSDVVQLSTHCYRYDFANQEGRSRISDWIETAAFSAGC